MNKTLIFLSISCSLMIFNIIAICTDPILTGTFDWKAQNCQHYADYRKYIDDEKIISDKKVRDEYIIFLKESQN